MVVIKTAAFITKHNKQELKMSESIRQKVRKQIMHFGLAFCTAVAVVFAMTGCSDSGSSEGAASAPSGKSKEASDNSTPAKYFRYTKEGNVMDGEYIVIRGLNTKCDLNGQLEVNLDEIWTKYQGKLIIPSAINGVPVKAVDINNPGGQQLPGGIVSLDGKIQDPDSLYLGNSSKWDGMITEVIVPDNVTSFKAAIKLPKLTQLTVNTEIKGIKLFGSLFGPSEQNIRVCFTGTSPAKPNFQNFSLGSAKQTFVFPETIKEIDISSVGNKEFFHNAHYRNGGDLYSFIDTDLKNFKRNPIEFECAQDAVFTWGNKEYTKFRFVFAHLNQEHANDKGKTLAFAENKYRNIDELLSELICEGIFVNLSKVNGKDTVIYSKMNEFEKALNDIKENDKFDFERDFAPELKKIFK